MAESLWVEVVSADGRVWEGDALSVVARTTEGDIGVLPNHEPLLAVLVPCAAEVLGTNNEREVIAVEGGFISVNENRVSLLSQYAKLAKSISLAQAEVELAGAQKSLDEGDTSDDTMHHYNRALAQVKAAQKAATR